MPKPKPQSQPRLSTRRRTSAARGSHHTSRVPLSNETTELLTQWTDAHRRGDATATADLARELLRKGYEAQIIVTDSGLPSFRLRRVDGKC